MLQDDTVYVISRTDKNTKEREFLLSFEIEGKHADVFDISITKDYESAHHFVGESHLARHVCQKLNEDLKDDEGEWETLPIGIPKEFR